MRPAFDEASDHQDDDVLPGLDTHQLREQHQRQGDQQVVYDVIAVIRPDRHPPLAVMQAVQRPPPGQRVLPSMQPVGGEVIEHEIDEERGQGIVAKPRQYPLQPRRREAPGPHGEFDLLHQWIGDHEDRQRNDAEFVQHRIDLVDQDKPVIFAGLLERPAALEETHADRDDCNLDDAQHHELDGIVARLIPGHQAEMKENRPDESLEYPRLDADPDVCEVAHGAPVYFVSPAVDAARTGPLAGPVDPDFSMNTPCGDLPTGMLATTFSCSMSTTATPRRKRCVTHSSLPSGVMSMQSGPPGIRTLPTTLISSVSISDTVLSTRLLR